MFGIFKYLLKLVVYFEYLKQIFYMKYILLLLLLNFLLLQGFSQVKEPKAVLPDSTKRILVVETACGQCQLGLKEKGCDLAVRINGKSYFVDGTTIDEHGDAHAKDGFCNAVRKAEAQGEVINNRFRVTYFKLINFSNK